MQKSKRQKVDDIRTKKKYQSQKLTVQIFDNKTQHEKYREIQNLQEQID